MGEINSTTRAGAEATELDAGEKEQQEEKSELPEADVLYEIHSCLC